ncbi:bifunctional DNA primase/polymerase [Thalassoglobus polymorphus]|uniref:DNA primase/polymerase bifunctional N-terminal domain-containing protein n=1 Tax=Thalassoglobus polymorphus TaxID=2527994 RepID=A0A517QGZ6_9PLAN|nr:bifunctional DNA primase/polymerase [Thalassoglobus polymorphus]QDT30909.1 hypothetical protein Mal48_01380 [Thalassoglobus polymorphus]QDT30954.1 hypothetical protein Mal48_01830 [Thalassoglobus polymorphus]
MQCLDYAKELHEAGISVFPVGSNKVPRGPWKRFIKTRPTAEEVQGSFSQPVGIGRVCGAISGNLEAIDFDIDDEAETDLTTDDALRAWAAIVDELRPGLRSNLCLIRTPRPGYHVNYRCESPVEGNQKLAYVPSRSQAGKWKAILETRGEGGYCLSPGSADFSHPLGASNYQHIAGPKLSELQTITADERAVLLQAARQFNCKPELVSHERPAGNSVDRSEGIRPGDDFEQRTTWAEILEPAGFTFVGSEGDTGRWRRPGTKSLLSATTNAGGSGLFYPFSPNCGMEPNRGYNKFSVYAWLNHGGDMSAAANELTRQGYGKRADLSHVNIDEALRTAEKRNEEKSQSTEFPSHLLHVPGMISGLIDYTIRTAFIPQPVLSLAASISLMGALIGRKVTDDFGSRANVYTVGLCRSGGGKEHSRKVNKAALVAGQADPIIGPEEFVSGPGIINAIGEPDEPALLFQNDEIGRFLKSIGNGQKNPHLYQVVTVLMKLFTSSDSVFLGAAYADSKKNIKIDCPNACLYGTTVPGSFFDSLEKESLTDGFVSRLLIFEGDDNAEINTRPVREEFPAELAADVKRWFEFKPGGNLSDITAQPRVVQTTPDAGKMLMDFTVRSLSQRDDDIEQALWSRAGEKARKLALIHACSESFDDPLIDTHAAEWAIELVTYLTQRLLSMAVDYVSENEHERSWKKLERVIQDRGSIRSSELHAKTRFLKASERWGMLKELESRGVIAISDEGSSGGRRASMITWTGD